VLDDLRLPAKKIAAVSIGAGVARRV